MSMRETLNPSGPSAFGRRAQIWHAFNALDEQKKGEVLKSQLKVLSHNLLTGVGLMEFDDTIEHFKQPCTALSFSDYMTFIDEMLKKAVGKSMINTNISMLQENLDRICWFICLKSYTNQPGRTLDENNCFKLWCIFNNLTQTDEHDEPLCPLEVDIEEVEIIMQKIHRLLGIVFKKENVQQLMDSFDLQFLTFSQLLKLIEKYLFGADLNVINTIVAELYEEYVLGVIKKGYLSKKGHIITNWKDRWCTMTPRVLRYYVSRDEKELKGEIRITSKCTVEGLTDKFGSKQNRFVVKSEGKDYEISAPDPITKREWIAAFSKAIKYHTDSGGSDLTKAEIRERRISRLTRREKLTEEQKQKSRLKELMAMTQQQLEQEMAKGMEMEKKIREEEEKRLKNQDLVARTKEELEAVKKARIEADTRWASEAAQLEREKQHLRELQELHKQLAVQLEKEKFAREQEELSRKKHEEIAKAEIQKKQELEDIQAAFESLLLDEKQKRENLEETKLLQEALLQKEKQRLEQLEAERKERDQEYQLALHKLRQAELEKEEAQRLLRKKKETPFGSAFFKFIEAEVDDEIPVNPVSHRGQDFILVTENTIMAHALRSHPPFPSPSDH